MSYHFSVDINEDSYIILGDMKGTIMVLSFSSVKKGPFRQTFHQDISHHRYEAVVKVSEEINLPHPVESILSIGQS